MQLTTQLTRGLKGILEFFVTLLNKTNITSSKKEKKKKKKGPYSKMKLDSLHSSGLCFSVSTGMPESQSNGD